MATWTPDVHIDDCPFCAMEGSIYTRSTQENQQAKYFATCPACNGTGSLTWAEYDLNPLEQQFVEEWAKDWQHCENQGFAQDTYPFQSPHENEDFWWRQWFEWDQEFDVNTHWEVKRPK